MRFDLFVGAFENRTFGNMVKNKVKAVQAKLEFSEEAKRLILY